MLQLGTQSCCSQPVTGHMWCSTSFSAAIMHCSCAASSVALSSKGNSDPHATAHCKHTKRSNTAPNRAACRVLWCHVHIQSQTCMLYQQVQHCSTWALYFNGHGPVALLRAMLLFEGCTAVWGLSAFQKWTPCTERCEPGSTWPDIA